MIFARRRIRSAPFTPATPTPLSIPAYSGPSRTPTPRFSGHIANGSQVRSVFSAELPEGMQNVCWFAMLCKVCNALVCTCSYPFLKGCQECQGNGMAYLAVLRGVTEKYHRPTCITRRLREANIVTDRWPEMAVPQCSDSRGSATCISPKRLAGLGRQGECASRITLGASLPQRQTAAAALVNNAGTIQR